MLITKETIASGEDSTGFLDNSSLINIKNKDVLHGHHVYIKTYLKMCYQILHTILFIYGSIENIL